MVKETPEQFWQRVEEEIGEKPLYHTMARCRVGCVEKGSTNWGLFFISPSAVHLWIFPRESWVSRLMASPGDTGSQSEERLRIPIDEIESADFLRPSLLERIMGAGSKNQVRITTVGEGDSYVFEGLEKGFPGKVVPIVTSL
jgi:hypothetical protein